MRARGGRRRRKAGRLGPNPTLARRSPRSKKGDEVIDRPALTIHPAPAGLANGAAVIVNPGGGCTAGYAGKGS